MRPTARFLLRAAGFGVAYYALARFSGRFVVGADHISILWLPGGLLLGVMLRTAPATWPAFFVGALAGGAIGHGTHNLVVGASHAAIDAASTVLAAVLIRELTDWKSLLRLRPRELLVFAFIPNLVSIPLSATIGTIVLNGLGPAEPFWRMWRLWWASATLGTLALTPLVVTVEDLRDRARTMGWWRVAAELASICAVVVVIAYFVLFYGFAGDRGPPLGWVMFPLLLFTAGRFGPAGVSVCSVILCVMGAEANLRNVGLVGALGLGPADRTILLHFLMGVLLYSSLIYASWASQYREAYQAHRESEARYRSIFENSVEAIFRTNAQGRYIEANPATARLLGFDSPDHLMRELRSPEVYADPAQRDEVMLRLRRDGEIRRQEFLYRRRDGTTRWAWFSARAVRNEDGEFIGVEGVAHDIDAWKRAEIARERLERQLRQAQKMEALGTLTGGIAHDFNNILAAVYGSVHMLRLDLGEGHPSRALVDEILRATERATSLVRQILTFSQRHEQARRPTDLTPVVHEIVALERSVLPPEIVIRVTVPDEVPMVLADPTQIYQVLMNLVTNAGHAMLPGGGNLDITVSTLPPGSHLGTVGELGDREYLCLTVRDTGRGMDAVTLERIFEPFFTTKGPGEGTGLGLAVVHGIVEGHDGVIDVRSEPGKGTTFQVCLPVLEESLTPGATPEAPDRGSGEHILFVDDEPALVRMAVPLLERLGYRVTGFTAPHEALAAFEKSPGEFDAVITDLSMAKLTGLELGEKILAIRQDIPILIATGFNSALTPELVQQRGFQDLLLKPFSPDRLGEALQRGLRRGSS